MADQIINIRTLIDATKRDLTRIQQEQFPFALAKTLTDIAKGAADIVRKETRSKFDLKTEFIPKGIGILPAKKSDVRAGSGHSAVFTKPIISGFMPSHEYGDTRTPKGKSLAIPTEMIKTRSYRLRTGQVKKSYKPSTLLHGYMAKNRKVSFTGGLTQSRGSESPRKQAFVIKGKGSNVPIVVRRRTKKRYPLELLYIFSRRAKYRAVWGFESSVKDYVYRAFPNIFNRNMNQAIRTARV